MTKIAFTNEIGGAFLSDGGDIDALISDANGYIFSNFSVDLGSSSLMVVENSVDSVNLTLPYYSVLDQMSSTAIAEHDLHGASGGEVFVSVIAVIVSAVAGTAATAGIAVGSAALVQGNRGKHLDGSKK